MKGIVYDAGVLVAADKNERRVWAEHRVRLELGMIPLVPAPVVAQVSRSPRQAQLHRLLVGCEVVSMSEAAAHRAGALLGKARTADVADAAIVDVAATHKATILTSDPTDIRRLVTALGGRVDVFAI